MAGIGQFDPIDQPVSLGDIYRKRAAQKPADEMSTRERAMFTELLLVRVKLGLSPLHSTVEAVRVLHDEGREAFEAMRGPACSHSSEWFPK